MKFALAAFLIGRIGCVTFVTFVMACRATAADTLVNLPVKLPYVLSNYDWTGLYLGGYVGYARGHANTTISDPGTNLDNSSAQFGALYGGEQVGYNYLLPSTPPSGKGKKPPSRFSASANYLERLITQE